jgi:membrane protein implicated in regulation of membrane protease activity
MGRLLALQSCKIHSLNNMTPHHWLILSIAFVVVEILPPPTHFFFLCLAFGALAAAVTAAYSSVAWLPWAVFAVASLALLPVLIPLAKFLFTPNEHKTNVDALIGVRALVIHPISAEKSGIVKVGGEEWRATTEKEPFAKDEWVHVHRVDGTQVTVRRNP